MSEKRWANGRDFYRFNRKPRYFELLTLEKKLDIGLKNHNHLCKALAHEYIKDETTFRGGDANIFNLVLNFYHFSDKLPRGKAFRSLLKLYHASYINTEFGMFFRYALENL